MPDITISLTSGQAQRFGAACTSKLLRHFVEDTGIEDPTPQQLGEWCFKYLGRKFVMRYEREQYERAFTEDPFEEP